MYLSELIYSVYVFMLNIFLRYDFSRQRMVKLPSKI